jgi:hypothetical protein
MHMADFFYFPLKQRVLNCLLVINSAEACLMYLPEHFKEEDCAELAALSFSHADCGW